MRYRVHLSDDAERDIEDVHRYVASQDGLSRADLLLAALVDVCRKLESFPKRGHLVRELEAIGVEGFREIHFKPYRVFYEIEANRVTIHAVLDGRRDMQTLLRQRLMR
jgi:toxin ParE1/3/4